MVNPLVSIFYFGDTWLNGSIESIIVENTNNLIEAQSYN